MLLRFIYCRIIVIILIIIIIKNINISIFILCATTRNCQGLKHW